MAKRDIFGEITQQIIAAIEAGAGEYKMPWNRVGDALHAPINAISRRPYRGVNTLLLWAMAEAQGYGSGRWATYQQWRQIGGQVRKGEQSTAILFWKPIEPNRSHPTEDEAEDAGPARLLARVYHVFNADQVGGHNVVPQPTLDEAQRIDGADAFFSQIEADVRHRGDQACYVPALDQVRIPHFSQFRSAAGYYSVLAHELTHWTGAKRRLDRDLSGRFGSASYAMEELVAELGAAFLMGELGLACEPRRDHAPYIASWLEVLRGDAKAIVTAASRAQAAADYIIGLADRPAQLAA